MVEREIKGTLCSLMQGFPVVTITGPRQSGKSTLAKAVSGDKPYLSLEDPDVRQFALDDPRAFLARLPNGAVLDEVQRAPDLLSYLQSRVDEDGRMGLFLLTGSQQFGLLSGVTQSLAGRSAFVELLPFSVNELQKAGQSHSSLDSMLFTGSYPPIYDRSISPTAWLAAYVTAYVERDVRQLLNVQDLLQFQHFVRLCAGRSGQLLNLSSLATECGIRHNTAKAWISVLEASYLVFRLRPYHKNFGKRIIKSPKLYFYDTGLLCWLLGVQDAEQLVVHPLRGAIFETFVVSELIKTKLNRGEQASFHFWRDSNGNEIDVIADLGVKSMPIEIKSGQTLNRDFFKALKNWLPLVGKEAVFPSLVYGGSDSHVQNGVRVFGWDAVAEVLSFESVTGGVGARNNTR